MAPRVKRARSSRTLVFAAIVTAGCHHAPKVSNKPTQTGAQLYATGVAEYERGKWNAAIAAFEQATILLPPRDTLLPRGTFLLARAYDKKKSYILSAATYKRLFEGFPEDSLADDAVMGMADADAKMWRGPEFDPHNAVQALEAYSLLQRLFPASPLVKQAQQGEARMNEGLARKDYLTGLYYYRHKWYDSALIPLRDAAQLYPGTAGSRDAMLKMVEIYRHLKYAEDMAETCKSLRTAYSGDDAVAKACIGIRADTAG